MRKNPIARTVRRHAKGWRTNLGVTPTAGVKSLEKRGKTSASGKASYRATTEQKHAKIF